MTWREGASVSVTVGTGWTVLKALSASKLDKQNLRHPTTLKGPQLLSCVSKLFGTGMKSLTLGWHVTTLGKGFPSFTAYVLSTILV